MRITFVFIGLTPYFVSVVYPEFRYTKERNSPNYNKSDTRHKKQSNQQRRQGKTAARGLAQGPGFYDSDTLTGVQDGNKKRAIPGHYAKNAKVPEKGH
jgi:hypothetical protein